MADEHYRRRSKVRQIADSAIVEGENARYALSAWLRRRYQLNAREAAHIIDRNLERGMSMGAAKAMLTDVCRMRKRLLEGVMNEL